MKDSGKRMRFRTGGLKEPNAGRGRYDLISSFALQRLAIIYEKGALKYSENNWRKGMPWSLPLNSCLRHINQWRQGLKDEDHLAQAAWQLFALMEYEKTCKELDDRNNHKKKDR